MIDAFVTNACRLSIGERKFLADHLTWVGSDFHRALLAGTQKGTICLAMERGEIVGWARTEKWENWPTLEAFVRHEWRGRGVATYCAAGLVASNLFEESDGFCAVFRLAMMAVAARAGLEPVLFTPDERGWTVDWRRR